MNKYSTKKEIAQFLKVSESTIDRWRREGGLPFIKVQRKVLFKQEEVEKWLKEK